MITNCFTKSGIPCPPQPHHRVLSDLCSFWVAFALVLPWCLLSALCSFSVLSALPRTPEEQMLILNRAIFMTQVLAWMINCSNKNDANMLTALLVRMWY